VGKELETLNEFQDFFDLGLIGMAVTTPDNGRIYANDFLCGMLGYNHDEFAVLTWIGLTHPDDLSADVEEFKLSMAGKIDSYSLDKRLLHKRGGIIHVKISVKCFRTPEGRVAYFLALIDDIRGRIRDKQQIILERNRVANILEGTNAGTWDWYVQTGKLTLNERWALMLGYSLEELQPVTVETWKQRLHPDDLATALKSLDQHFSRLEGYYDVEFRMRHKDGSWVWINARGKVIEWTPDDKPHLMSGTHLDVTPRKVAEEKRLALERQVLHTQKLESLGILAGGIAHDFNNLLTAIMGHAGLALDLATPGSLIHKYIEESLRGGREATELTRQMLAYSGKGQFVIKSVNLSSLVEEMGRLLAVSISKECKLQYHFDPALPDFEADEAQVKQVIMNLIINASDAIGNHPGVITVTTGVTILSSPTIFPDNIKESLPAGAYGWLEVTDTGCGMSEETTNKIFDPFFTTKVSGRGIGLATVMGIVRSHQGTIQVDSSPAKGTAFRVLFPITRLPASNEFPPSTGKINDHFTGTALVIDDEPPSRRLADRMLSTMGFHVMSARNGVEALDIFKKDHDIITLVLLDLTMPEMSGAQTFQELLKINPDTKVIICSGYSTKTSEESFPGQQPAGFIQKPFSFEDLTKAISQVLTHR